MQRAFSALRAAFFSRSLRAAAFWTALAAVSFLSLMPHDRVDAAFSPDVQACDKQFHAVAYVALAALHLAAFVRRGRVSWRLRAAVFALYSLLGGAFELAQTLPAVNRSASWSDAANDAVGAAAGAFLLPRLFLLP